MLADIIGNRTRSRVLRASFFEDVPLVYLVYMYNYLHAM